MPAVAMPDARDTTIVDNSNVTGSTTTIPGMAGMPTGIADDFATDPYASANYEVFDPLNWMLDGTVDFPFTFNQPSAGDQLNTLTADI